MHRLLGASVSYTDILSRYHSRLLNSIRISLLATMHVKIQKNTKIQQQKMEREEVIY